MDGTAVTERLAHPELRERLDAADLEALRGRVDDSLHRQGVTFGPRRFEVDPVPRVIEADEWRELGAGIVQRVQRAGGVRGRRYGAACHRRRGGHARAGPRGADHYEPELAGLRPPGGWIGVAGLDLLRGPDGRFAVVEDNLRTPSGVAYAARRPPARWTTPWAGRRPSAPTCARSCWTRCGRPCARRRRRRRGAAVRRAGHRRAVQRRPLGAPRAGRRARIALVRLDELELRGDRLYARRPGGHAARSTSSTGAPTRTACATPRPRGRRSAELLARRRGGAARWGSSTPSAPASPTTRSPTPTSRTWCASTSDEEPLLRSVDTYDLGDAGALEPRHWTASTSSSSSRAAATAAPAWSSARARRRPTRERARAAVRADPEATSPRRRCAFSRHPTVVDGRLEPRHVDLRPFAYRAGDEVRVVPGGLTRVAFARGRARGQLVARRRRPRTRGCCRLSPDLGPLGALPSEPFTVGVEEEVMLLDPDDWALAQEIDDVLPRRARATSRRT